MLGLILLVGGHRRRPLRWLLLLDPPFCFDGYDWGLGEDVIVLVLSMASSNWRVISGDSYEQCVLGNYSCNR